MWYKTILMTELGGGGNIHRIIDAISQLTFFTVTGNNKINMTNVIFKALSSNVTNINNKLHVITKKWTDIQEEIKKVGGGGYHNDYCCRLMKLICSQNFLTARTVF